MVGMHTHLRSGLFHMILSTPLMRKEEKEAKQEAYRLLQYVGLESLYNEEAKIYLMGRSENLKLPAH